MDRTSDNSGAARPPQAEVKHPEEWRQDLNPDQMAGQNVGDQFGNIDRGMPNAYDFKEVHRALSSRFDDDELRQIPVMREGERLKQGATYFDLEDPQRGEFTATGDMQVEPSHRVIPKADVPYSLWNRLIGVDNPDRIPDTRRPRD